MTDSKEEKYCSKCGREIKENFRTIHEIVENINRMLNLNSWDIKGKRSHLIDLERAIEKLKSEAKDNE